MKKSIFYILPVALLLGACTKDISSYNDQTKKAAVVPAAPLYTYGTLTLTNQLANIGGGNITLHIVDYMAQAIIEDNAQYNFQTAGMPNTQWNVLYESCLNNLKRADSILRTTIPDATNSAATIANRRACVDITAVYAWYILVTSYGNIPYTQALNPDNSFPKYDDQHAIYTDLLKRLDNDLANLSTGGSGFAVSEDLWFHGNIPNWITFANSLEMRMGMTLADVDPATAKSVVEAASPNAMTSTAQNCIMQYGSAQQQPRVFKLCRGQAQRLYRIQAADGPVALQRGPASDLLLRKGPLIRQVHRRRDGRPDDLFDGIRALYKRQRFQSSLCRAGLFRNRIPPRGSRRAGL